MRKVVSLSCLVAFALVLVSTAKASPMGYPSLAALNVLWRVKLPGNDYMTTPFIGDIDSYPSDGAIFYVPSSNIASTSPFYRLFKSSIPDHMDSFTLGEDGYNTDLLLGYPYSSSTASSGIGQIMRYRKGTTDRAIGRADESASFTSKGYSLETAQAGWAYQRFNQTAEALLSLSAGGVTIESNAVAGGALWKWTWGGTQFLNYADYGRQMQSSMSYFDASNIQHLPTEGGDRYTGVTVPVERRHGSPLLAFSNSGNTQTTRGVPLEFDPAIAGGNANHPVIYNDLRELGKNITLNYNNLGAVARYDTRWYMPTAMNGLQIEIPTAYLRGIFNRYYTYNAVLDSRTEVFPASCSATNVGYTTNYGGVIISDSTGTNAMGVYGKGPGVSGPVSYFTLWNFLCNPGGGNGASDINTSKWSAVYGPANYNIVGYYQATTWIVTGTLSQVQQLMRNLYLTPPSAAEVAKTQSGDEDFIQIGSAEPGWNGEVTKDTTRTWIGQETGERHMIAADSTK